MMGIFESEGCFKIGCLTHISVNPRVDIPWMLAISSQIIPQQSPQQSPHQIHESAHDVGDGDGGPKGNNGGINPGVANNLFASGTVLGW
jgi:hypothetical protein